MTRPLRVIPAKAGTQSTQKSSLSALFSQVWAPAFAGVTESYDD
jgi:hypothetical protein